MMPIQEHVSVQGHQPVSELINTNTDPALAMLQATLSHEIQGSDVFPERPAQAYQHKLTLPM